MTNDSVPYIKNTTNENAHAALSSHDANSSEIPITLRVTATADKVQINGWFPVTFMQRMASNLVGFILSAFGKFLAAAPIDFLDVD